MSSDWWSKKLSGQPTQTTQRPALPPVQAPIRFPVQVPAQAPTQQYPQTQQDSRVLDPSKPPNAEISMGDALRLWKGGEAMRREGNTSCPACGSHLVFSRSKNSMVGGKAPAPRCFECGWNGLYDQGEQSNWAV